MPSPTQLLIVSFSPIATDARVLKQVERFSSQYSVTTCGYGPKPEGVNEHIRIPDDVPANDLNGRLITLHLYSRAYWTLGAVSWAKKALSGRRFDVILANDVETVPLALTLRPARGIHADLHEYSPRLHAEFEGWLRRIAPYYEWMCRRYVRKAQSWTTVGEGLAKEYKKNFGFEPLVVTNAAPFAAMDPQPVDRPIRLVHSGAALRKRNIHTLITAVAGSSADVTLDLFLTPNDPAYLAELRAAAGESDRITLHDPVPYFDLVRTLNAFDVGVHFLPPVNFNNEWALPNKLFDYVQARLGIIVGPSAEMAKYVERYRLGVIADDFSIGALQAAITGLNVEDVAVYKSSADTAADELSAARQVDVWDGCVAGLAS
ncbi:glycosyltransferase involved in cell wall biosynthesis [Mycetocola sp. CAN_C7]|uniref:glycosyltransferase family 1 protein n=1 Tax=Mycetocola sp. CAN_C7 TaxID=2787724 RepID=UPI0018C900D4